MIAMPGVLRQRGESRTVQMGKNSVSFILTGEETGGAYSLTEFTVAAPPAPGPPVHIHGTGSEAAYVLEGEVELRLGDRSVRASAGAAIFVPRGTTHNVTNAGAGTAKILVILSPPGFEGYWREMSELPLTDGKPDPKSVLSLQAKYKMDTGGQARQL
jgi:quercetin dioxygenase-like cupin family protein